MSVVELMILGFLSEEPAHGYKLRKQMAQLSGYARIISDGTLYPAIKRLVQAGLIKREPKEPTSTDARQTLAITQAGRARLEWRLSGANGLEITDANKFYVVMAFLSFLPSRTDRKKVLQRRLNFLDQPASFFYDGDVPLQLKDISDPYKRGILLSARATSRAERAWLKELIESLE